MQPKTRYARSGTVNIAYQVVGDGPRDLIYVMGWVSHLEAFWMEPSFERFFRRLASFSRLILFDKRGTGLSDRVAIHELPTLEQRMDDVRAVMDAAGSQRAALLGVSEADPCAPSSPGLAGPGEVLVSSTVKDLVAGSGIGFEDRGIHALKGIPDRWRLFEAVTEGAALSQRGAAT